MIYNGGTQLRNQLGGEGIQPLVYHEKKKVKTQLRTQYAEGVSSQATKTATTSRAAGGRGVGERVGAIAQNGREGDAAGTGGGVPENSITGA